MSHLLGNQKGKCQEDECSLHNSKSQSRWSSDVIRGRRQEKRTRTREKAEGRVKITSFKSSLECLTKGTTIPLVYCSSGHREQRERRKKKNQKKIIPLTKIPHMSSNFNPQKTLAPLFLVALSHLPWFYHPATCNYGNVLPLDLPLRETPHLLASYFHLNLDNEVQTVQMTVNTQR